MRYTAPMNHSDQKNGNHRAENMLKGRMAESLVEEMLKRSGNTVYRFGYESVIQNLSQLESHFDRHTEVGERIRAIPDYVVIDKKGTPSFAEVKFRAEPRDLYDETIESLERVEKYWNALIVFVNCVEKPYFRISRPPYFKTISQPKRGLNFEPLTDVKEWGISDETYAEYEQLVEKYLSPSIHHA